MVYRNLIKSRETLEEEFGIDKFTKRIVVSPILWKRVFPNEWIEIMKKEFEVKGFVPKDPHLSILDKNYMINNTLFLFLGRGLTEFTDRIFILLNQPEVKEIVFVGLGASLLDEILPGDINLPPFVLPWENVSSKLVDISEAIPKASDKLLRNVTDIAKKIGKKHNIKIHNFNHVTIELAYSETEELLKYFREFKIGTIDMELSSLYRLANYYNKRAVGVIRAGDRPLHNEYWYSSKWKSFKERKREGNWVLFETIAEYIKD